MYSDSLRTQTVLSGIGAPCYQHHKVPQLHAAQSDLLKQKQYLIHRHKQIKHYVADLSIS